MTIRDLYKWSCFNHWRLQTGLSSVLTTYVGVSGECEKVTIEIKRRQAEGALKNTEWVRVSIIMILVFTYLIQGRCDGGWW